MRNISEESLLNLEEIVTEELLTKEDVQEMLVVNHKGTPIKGLENLEIIFKNDPQLRGAIRRNELNGRNVFLKESAWKRKDINMDDTDTNNITLYIEKTYGITYPTKSVDTMIDIIANEHSYHPIRELLESLEWDGKPRIAEALHYFLGADKDVYTAEVMQMHMLAAINRVYRPGCKYDIMLCLVGGQGAGKSTFFRYLAMNDDWFSDDLKNLDSKDVKEYMEGHWIIEMPEVAALVKSKVLEETKAFLSRTKDTYRTRYTKTPKDWERQCIFCGTSNDMAFLPLDRTGNRRFAPVTIHPEKAECLIYEDEAKSRAYIQQMWAEAMVIYRSEKYTLTFTPAMEDYVKVLQKEFMPEDPLIGMIQAFLDSYDDDYVCAAILYQRVMGQYGIPKPWESKEIGEIMNNSITGWVKHGNHRFKGELGTQRSWKRLETSYGYE